MYEIKIKIKKKSPRKKFCHRRRLKLLCFSLTHKIPAPIPGGCNVEFDIKVSPFQKVLVTEATVTIDAQAASMPKITGKPMRSCDTYSVKLEAYRLYLPERDFSIKTYFDGILKMMTVQDIIANGKKVKYKLSCKIMNDYGDSLSMDR